ncbi:MAG: zf-HC2 domain-containing protein [Myxococcales bacterium]|nr:zf-HC2 domain-containing protein [Myxococcales bacterium]
MLTCQQLTEIITDYTEGRMSWRERFSVQLHLGMCRHCRAYLRQLRTTVKTLGALPPEPMPDDVKAELMRRLRDLKK